MHLKNQRPVLVPFDYWPELESLSKAALMDLVWSFGLRCAGEEDMPHLTMQEIERERDAVLATRKQAKTAAAA